MTMPLSGSISISQLNTEFGRGYALGSYTQAGSGSAEAGLMGVNRCALSSFYGRKLGGHEFPAGNSISFTAPVQAYIDSGVSQLWACAGGGGGGHWYAGLLFPGGGGGSGGYYWPANHAFTAGNVITGSVGLGGSPASDGQHTLVYRDAILWLDYYPGLRGGSGYTENGYGGAGGTPNGQAGTAGVQAVGAAGGVGGNGPQGPAGLGCGGHGGGNGDAEISPGIGGYFGIRWNNS